MSRDTLTLKKFNSGVITQVHQEDSPLEAFVWAKDIDPETTDGRVQGIEDLGSDITVGDKARISAFIENDGVYDLILHNSGNDKITAVVDFYNGASLMKELDLLTSNIADNSTIITNNKEVHIGAGNGSANVPKWIGYQESGQFSNGLSWTITGATNASPIVVTAAGHSLKDGNLAKIASVGGNTAANGIWIIASSDPAAGTFALTGSTGNGAYTAGGTATQHLVIENDELANYTNIVSIVDGQFNIATAATAGSAPQFFTTGKTYYWAMSYVYDGYQESPLADTGTVVYKHPFTGISEVSDTPGAATEYYTLTITAYGADDNEDAFNKRITGINLYRAEAQTTADKGLYKLVAYIDINDTNWTAGAGDKVIDVVDRGNIANVSATEDINYGSATYEENSGITESLSRTMVNHALSSKGNGYAFYGNCYHPSITDAERYIFRSKYYRFSMVDWSQDFLIMPRPLTAMAFYEGRLYAFDLNNTYRINPETLSIEDVFEGIGASGQRSVTITPYGMFIANINGAYQFDGQNFSELSLPIKNTNYTGTGLFPASMSWANFEYDTFTDIIVVWSAEKECVIFANTDNLDSAEKIIIWAWNIPRKRWDFWDIGAATVSAGFITGKDGEVYLSEASTTKRLFAGSRKLFSFVTKEFDFDDPSQDKSINMLKWDGSNLTIKYDYNGSDPAAGTTATSGAYINQYKRTIQLYVLATNTASYLDSLDIVFRQKVGKR